MDNDQLKNLLDEQRHEQNYEHIDSEAAENNDSQFQHDQEDAVNSESTPDYYAILNVPRNASKEEIKAAYRRLSIMFHPDKLNSPEADEQMMEYASEKFSLINSAYQVLCNEETRKIYDTLGHEGLNEMMQVGIPLKSTAELHAEFAKFKYEQKKKNVEDLIKSTAGNMEVKLDVSSIFDRHGHDYYDDYDRGAGGFLTGDGGDQQFASVEGLQLVQSTSVSIDPVTSAGISGVIVSRNNKGGGYILINVRRVINHTQEVEGELALGNNTFASIKYAFPAFTDFARVNLNATWEYMPWTGPPTLGVSVTRSLSSKTSGTITYNTGIYNIRGWGISDGTPDDSIELTLKRSGRDNSIRSTLVISPDKSSIQIKYKHIIDKTMSLEVSAQASTKDTILSASAGSSIILAPNYRYGSFLQVDSSGEVSVKMALTRFTTTISIPLSLSHDLDWKALGFGMTFPIFSIMGLKKLSHLLRSSKSFSSRRRVDEQKKKAAERDVDIMRGQYKRKLEDETAKNGLLVEKALYGAVKDLTNTMIEMESPRVIDVTIPVQMACNDSQLVISNIAKSQLLGFYDPCPGEKKCLVVNYKFKGRQHKAIVADDEPLVAPMKSHQTTL